MKTHSNELFLLIKSLDTQEKIFFKSLSRRKRADNEHLNYLKLFDAIDSLKIYDEKKLRNKLQKVNLTYNFSKAKNYLSQAVLKSLAEYHSDTSVHFQIQNLIYQAELLYGKRLNRMADKLIAKVEKLALKHEEYSYLLKASSVKIRNVRQTANILELNKYLENGIVSNQHYLDCIKNTIEFTNIVVALECFDDVQGNRRDNKKLESIFKSELLSSPKKALTYISLRNYYYIHFLRCRLMGAWGKAAYLQQFEWVKYLESDTDNLKFRSEYYLASLGRLIVTCNHSKLYSKIETIFLTAKQYYESLTSKIKTRGLKTLLISLTNNYMSGLIDRCEPEKAIELWENVKNLVSFQIISDGLKMVLYGNLFFSNYLLIQHKEAIIYLNKIINFNKSNRLDIQAMARIYILLINFELGNIESLKYISNSSKRWLIKNNFLGKFEIRLIQFFQIELFTSENSTKLFELKNLRSDLIRLNKQSRIRFPLIADVYKWIESQIQSKPILELLREEKP